MENACDLYLAKIPALIYNSAVMCAFLVGSVLLSGGNGSDIFEGSFLAPCGIRECEALALPAESSWWDGQDTTKETLFNLENSFPMCPPTHFVLILKFSFKNSARTGGI